MKTILVVDDERGVTELLADILGDEGYRVITALDGAEGLRLAEARQPDLIISDVMMPKLDGRGLVHAIRAHPQLRDTPVVLMSAGYAERGELAGKISEFVPKPFSITQIIEVVADLLS